MLPQAGSRNLLFTPEDAARTKTLHPLLTPEIMARVRTLPIQPSLTPPSIHTAEKPATAPSVQPTR